MWMHADINELMGKTLTHVDVIQDAPHGGDEIHFYTEDGGRYKLHHEQECCEEVELNDVCGDLKDLVGTPILVAEEVSHQEPVYRLLDPATFEQEEEGAESFTWTFYKIDTVKGGVTIRWFGASNGYYSESADFSRYATP